jgi:ribulose-phosphate 3-epimerase
MQIIPVLNCLDRESAEEKIAVAKKFLKHGDFLHIDVADGAFTFHKTWNDAAGWTALHPSFPLEVHLMVEHPDALIAPWLAAGAKRFIVHIETVDEDALKSITAKCKAGGAELMLSSNPETPADEFTPYLHDVSCFQILAVNPGLAGQKFLPLTLEKVKWLKAARPDAIIEVDGGITPEWALRAKDAGADIVVSASYIFGSDDPERAYAELKKI